MGTEVHCKNHVPGYYSLRDINEDSNSSSWSLFFGDKTLLNGEYYNGFTPRTVTDVYPGYEKDALKQKMLEHEAAFKNQVHGFVQDNRTWEKVAMLFGKWDEAMYYVLGNPTTKLKGYDPMTEDVLLWERGKSITKTRYNLTPFAISLNELTPGLLEKLPPTDSRLRPDQRHLENGEYELANAEKLRLEQLQRQARKLQERGWQPRWFRKDEDGCYIMLVDTGKQDRRLIGKRFLIYLDKLAICLHV